MNFASLKKKYDAILEEVSKALSEKDVPLETYGSALALAREIEKTIDSKDESNFSAVAKAAIVETVKKAGQKLDGKASTVLARAGWYFSMYPSRTGTDPKKFQAKLIAIAGDKKKSVALLRKYMVPEEVYSLDPALVLKAVKDKVLTTADVKDCEYDESWTLATPKQD